jgi:phosphatidylinositol alpha-1,6-mannosyltransferase
LWLDVAGDILAQLPRTAFVIIGDGEQEDELRKIIATRNLSQSVLLLGPRGHEELPNVYRAADLFLLSSHYEGFGRVVLEAAFAGVPTVATRCSGPEDIIDDGVSGFLVEKADREGLAEGVLALLRDDEQRAQFGSAARALAHSRFGQDALASKLVTHWSHP